MKQYFKILSCILVFTMISTFFSCKKNFLGQVPDDNLNLKDVFERKVYTERFLANIYSTIRTEIDHNTENTPWEGLSDEMDITYDDYPTYAMNVGNWDRDRGSYNYWGYYYRGIRNASFFLENAISGRSKDLTEEELVRFRAEARFLRAYFYFMLVRQYGPVILLPETPLPADSPLESFNLPRNSYDECVNYIVSEIDKSLPDLQEPNPADNVNQYARMNKGMALAVKSRVLLYAASPLFNGNSDYAGFKNQDGKQLISQTYDAGKWKKAADAAKAVIDLNKYSLYKENTDGVYNPYLSLKNVFLKDWNTEVIMAKTSDLYPIDKNGSPYTVGGWSSWGPTQSAVDAYFMANGQAPVTGYSSDGSPVINSASGYVETGVAGAATKYYAAGTSNMYVNREPRFYVAITFDQSKWINSAKGTTSDPLVITMYNGGNSGKYSGRNWSRTGYVTRKLVHPGSTVNPDVIVKRTEIKIRLAEIYLNYAEALFEYQPGDPDVLKYLNLIRERAGIPQYGQGANALPVPADLRSAIRQERRVELAFENFRYFDTRRWKIATQTDAGRFYGMNTEANNKTDFAKRTVFETRVFEQKHYLWNIIQTELNADKSLVENPGW